MAKVKWSKDSIEDLKKICKFIALDSPYYARVFNDRVFEMMEHLELFPKIGRRVPESDDPKVRELIYKGYRIIYQIREDYLGIITIIHGMEFQKETPTTVRRTSCWTETSQGKVLRTPTSLADEVSCGSRLLRL